MARALTRAACAGARSVARASRCGRSRRYGTAATPPVSPQRHADGDPAPAPSSTPPRTRPAPPSTTREPDRVPIVVGVSNATGMKMRPVPRPREPARSRAGRPLHLRLAGARHRQPDRGHPPSASAPTSGRSSTRSRPRREQRNQARPPHAPCIDDWGSGQVEVDEGHWFPGVHPLREAETLDAIEAYPWPDMDDPSRVAHVRAEAARLRADDRVRGDGDAVAALPARAGVRHAGHGDVPRRTWPSSRSSRRRSCAGSPASARGSWATSSDELRR